MSNPNIQVSVRGPQQPSSTAPMTTIELTEAVVRLESSIDRSATDLPNDLTEEDTGYTTFSKTLGKPVWWNGTAWVDAIGATV